jgi:hypothetical protein
MEKHNHNIVILRAQDKLTETEAQQKAKAFSLLQEELYTLTIPLSNKLRIHDVYVTKNENRTSIFLDMPLFYNEEPTIHLTIQQQSSFQKEYGVNTNSFLSMEIFSDLETLPLFEKQLNENHKLVNVVETSYYFAKDGSHTKVVTLPTHLRKRKKPIYEDDEVREYISEMTTEDFLYAGRALTVMKQRLEDYHEIQKLLLSQ